MSRTSAWTLRGKTHSFHAQRISPAQVTRNVLADAALAAEPGRCTNIPAGRPQAPPATVHPESW